MANKNTNNGNRVGLPLEKILTLSAGEYATMVGRGLHTFEAVGIEVSGGKGNNGHQPRKELALVAPEGTEAIVGYNAQIIPWIQEVYKPSGYGTNSGFDYFAYGTALIPKDGVKPQKDYPTH